MSRSRRVHTRKPDLAITATAAVALLIAPALLWSCGGSEGEPPVPQRAVADIDSGAGSERPAESVYGIDEVVPAVARLQEPAPVAPTGEVGEPVLDTEPAGNRETRSFVLPELDIYAGDGMDHLAEGQRLYTERRFLEAAAHLSVAAEESPTSWYVRYLLGLSLWKAGDLDGAQVSLQAAAERHPEFVKTFINLSRVLNDAGRFGEALAAADRAVALQPEHAEALYLRGRSLANVGRPADAETVLQAALEAAPENGHIRNRLGLLLIRQGRFEEAVPVLEAAASLLPEVAHVRNNLGIAYENTGRFQDAARQYARGAELDPDSTRLATNLARVNGLVESPVTVAETSGDEQAETLAQSR